nr:8-amino-7-oxononanoate synthase [Marinibactrum halimedae]
MSARLSERKREHRYRYRRVLSSAQGPRGVVDGKAMLSFASNDYLGLANHPKVTEALTAAAKHCGVGSGASHLVNGHSHEHHQLEEALAEFTGRDRALLFGSGYMANLACITALMSRSDWVLEDRLNHASLLDAGLHSGAAFKRYQHNSVGDAQKWAERLSGKQVSGHGMIVTDGVFSMDGDVAPLNALSDLAQSHNAWLMVDDAHGFGVLGPKGAGCVDDMGLSQQQVPILMGTLGKALGCYGAFIAGSDVLIESLIQFARPYIYTTATPPAIAAAARAALKLVELEPQRRECLNQHIAYFRREAEHLPVTLLPSHSPIQPLLIGDEESTMAIAQGLESRGILVGAIRPPTVPNGTARLRITLSASHTTDDITQLLEVLHSHLST